MVLMCADCQAARGRGSGPYPVMTWAEMRAGLNLLPTWEPEQKAAANLQVIAAMHQRLAASEEVAHMYQEPGLAWLERQAEVADSRVSGCTTRQRVTQPRERWGLRLTATGGLGLGR
jgi:hypothetical protein